MPPTPRRCLALAGIAAILALPANAGEAPNIIASIKPVHSLVAGVMEGVGEPHLFVGGGDSPHTYAMRPSDAEALARADAVFWIGPEFEGFLIRPIENLAESVHSVPLIQVPGLVLYDYEDDHHHDHGHDEVHGHRHEAHSHGHGHEEADGHHDDNGHVHAGTDGHIWLDPSNARAMVSAITATLSEIDPGHADLYAANAERMKGRLTALEADTKERLAPYRDVAFYTFHEAFHYFAQRFDLNSRGAITISPERQPGARRLAAIRAEIGESDRVCIFAEPQFPPSLVEVVIDGTGAGTGIVDPLGAEIDDGPELYFQLIESNVDAFLACFEQV